MRWLLAAFALLSTPLFAAITPVNSFKQIEHELLKADANTLVVFDVDDVLITPRDLALRPCGEHFQPKSCEGLSEEKMDELTGTILNETPYLLIDPSAPKIIQSLQKRSIKTIALTSNRTGKLGVIPNMEDWRIEQLLDHNIDFNHSFPHLPTLTFPELNSNESQPTLYKRGILFVGGYFNPKVSTKGELLRAFFEKAKWKPKKVIFIDDRIKNLQSVEKALNEAGIEHCGFHYHGVNSLPTNFDAEIAELQYSHLLKTNEWLSDEQAKEVVAKKP